MEFVYFDDWMQLPASADALLDLGERQSVFLSRPWFENLLANGLEKDQSIGLACVIERDQLLAILPLLRFASGDWRALSHRYSALYSPLVSENARPAILACLAQGLSRMPVDAWMLEPVAEEDANMGDLERAMEVAGYRGHRYFRFYNWFHRTDGQPFADYLATRPARVRNTLARKKRKLAAEQKHQIRLFTGADAPAAMADYHAVFRGSWKATEQSRAFVDGMTKRFSERDWVRLAVLYIQGRPAAAQLWIVAHAKASVFRLAHDEAWKSYSPGTILTGFLMEHVHDVDRVTEIDYLTGNEAYKQDWMSERRERSGLLLARPPRAKTWFERIAESAKRVFR